MKGAQLSPCISSCTTTITIRAAMEMKTVPGRVMRADAPLRAMKAQSPAARTGTSSMIAKTFAQTMLTVRSTLL
ncbi:MAG: hypothetical protein IJK59_08080 [Firmicutes bacterium]|nr:hypothetical protein [Bacillota bacterium]